MKNAFLGLHKKISNFITKEDFLVIRAWNLSRKKKILKLSGNKLNNFFIKIYNNRALSNLYNCWGDRNRFIKEALDAHEKKNYLVSIPLLLIQIEGILMDLLRVKNYLTLEGSINELTTRLNEDRLTPFRKELIKFLTKRKHRFNRYAENKFSKDLSRSKILHGHELAYDNQINSIKCINLLDHLKEISNSLIYYDKKLKKYHLWHCEYAPYFEDKRRSYFYDDAENKLSSAHPHRICRKCLGW